MRHLRLGWLLGALALAPLGCAPPASLEITSRDGAGRPVPVPAVLTLPDGAGPHPAVVLMHGSGGVEGTIQSGWSETFRKAGIATLVLDSFRGRGISSTVTTAGTDKFHLPTERVWDAHAAAAWLRARPDIDPRRLVLMGQSQGGMVVLNAQQRIAGIKFDDFAAFIALYPLCGGTPMNVTYERPTLILIGADDDYTPAEQCEVLVAYKEEMRDPVPDLRVYPKAVHSFDVPGRGGLITAHVDGRMITARLEYSPSARQAAEADAMAFIRRAFAAPRPN